MLPTADLELDVGLLAPLPDLVQPGTPQHLGHPHSQHLPAKAGEQLLQVGALATPDLEVDLLPGDDPRSNRTDWLLALQELPGFRRMYMKHRDTLTS